MKSWKILIDAFRSMAKNAPGKRFENLYLNFRDTGPVFRVFGIILGTLLMLGGFLLGLVPGIPGIVLGVMGLGLIAAQFKSTALLADRMEISLRKFLSWIRGFFVKAAPRHVERPVLSPAAVTVNGSLMKIVDDGQHTGLESRFEEEMVKEHRKEEV